MPESWVLGEWQETQVKCLSSKGLEESLKDGRGTVLDAKASDSAVTSEDGREAGSMPRLLKMMKKSCKELGAADVV